jgi:predicted DNA binding CopG/RHH family protein
VPLLELFGSKNIDQDEILEAFNSLSTFFKYEKTLNEKNNNFSARQQIVSQKIETTYKKGSICYNKVTEKISAMPICQQLASFLELPNILQEIKWNIEKKQKLSNFINGKTWKQIKKNYEPDDFLIPLILYCDDFEPDNPIGSNAGNNKVTGFYYSLPAIPQHFLTSPDYIFIAQICNAKVKNEKLNERLSALINELKKWKQKDFV